MSEVPSPGSRRARSGRRSRRARWRVVLALTAAAVAVVMAVVVGPPSIGNFSQSQSSTALGLFDRITVSGRQGATPAVTVEGPITVSATKSRVIVAGEGREITEGQPILLSITAFSGEDGHILSEDGQPQLSAGLASEEFLDEDQFDTLIGLNEGSRVVFVRPVEEDGNVTTEIDVVDILSSVATGTEVEASDDDPLQVTLADEGPVISHGEEAPSQLVTQVLLRGDGAQIGTGDRVVAQFIITGWSDGEVRESTWTTGVPQVIDLDAAMPGVRDALVDQRVGSRIAVTIPPDQAAGDDTLCMVIDILGVESSTEGETAQSGGGD